MHTIHDAHTKLIESVGELAYHTVQEIPDEFLDHLADERHDSISTPAGEMHRVGSVPEFLALKWLRENPPYDCRLAPVEETMKRLKLEGYDKFVASHKRI